MENNISRSLKGKEPEDLSRRRSISSSNTEVSKLQNKPIALMKERRLWKVQ